MTPIDLEGRVAFVTGAGAGIGLAATRRLLEAGCQVVANVHHLTDTVSEVYAELAARYDGRVMTVEGSVTESAFIDQTVKTIFQRFKRLDVVVNNAGVMRDAYIGMISDDDIDLVLRTNLVSVIKVTQTMSRLMRRQKAGSIINLSSIIGRRGNTAELVYAASKAGVIGATYSASKELAPLGIRVNAIAPGLIDTAMTSELPAETRDRLTTQIAMGRTGTVDDVADLILFLASDLSRYITGQVIGVDGGLVL
jgi:3-oxoacyl-[acyl-carrier protein] reductase